MIVPNYFASPVHRNEVSNPKLKNRSKGYTAQPLKVKIIFSYHFEILFHR